MNMMDSGPAERWQGVILFIPFYIKTVFWGPCFHLRTAYLFSYGKNVGIITLLILFIFKLV